MAPTPNESLRDDFGSEATKILFDIIIPCLDFGLLLWRCTTSTPPGQTRGKRLLHIRVVSLVHPHMTWPAFPDAVFQGVTPYGRFPQ